MPLTFSIGVYDPSLDALARATAEQIERERRRTLNDEAAGPIRRWVCGGWWHGNRAYDGDFNVEDYWPEDADEPQLGELRIDCQCGRPFYPFHSRTLVAVDGGWRWVGLDHQEPYTDYFAVCGWCATPVLFTIHTPQ